MQINGKNYLIGADPEVFVKGLNSKEIKPPFVYPNIKGTKEKPQPVKHGAVQVDGMAMEFNIDPASNFEEFQANLEDVQAQLLDMLGPDAAFSEETTNTFSEDWLKITPLENLLLGCEPDMDAWLFCPNYPPEPKEEGFRTVGGHLHVGGFDTDDPNNDEHVESMCTLARIMDEEIGQYSLLWDNDSKRRTLYGRAGAMRVKSYGMEYRTLSNKWAFNPKLMKVVYDGVIRSIVRLVSGEHDVDVNVMSAINNSDFTKTKYNPKIVSQIQEALV